MCPKACETCILAKKVNKCLSKNCVYIIGCTQSHLVYMGETSRTVGLRIKEHSTDGKQTTYQHLVKHTNTPMLKDISWHILHNNIPQHQTRKIIEALEIRKKNTESIKKSCIVIVICPDHTIADLTNLIKDHCSLLVIYSVLQNNLSVTDEALTGETFDVPLKSICL